MVANHQQRTSTRRRRREETNDNKENIDSDDRNYKDVLREFRASAKRIGATALQNRELAETVVAASLGRPFGFLLAEYIDESVSTSRELIKKAASNKGKLDCVLDNVVVAVHVFRACWRLERHRTNLVRLLYHAVVTTADTLDSLKCGDPTLVTYGLAAWETLGRVLDGFEVSVGKRHLARCQLGKQMFPVPLPVRTVKEIDGDFSLDQFFSLGVHSTLAAARIVVHSTTLENPAHWCSFLHHYNIPQMMPETVSILVMTIALPWIQLCSNVSPTTNTSGFAKTARNTIWKVAESLDGEQLELKAKAVEAFLLHDRENPTIVTNAENINDACRFAAQVADASNCRLKNLGRCKRIEEDVGAFHNRVGKILDAKCKPHSAPNSYYDYCGYRELHASSPLRTCSEACWMRGLPGSCRHVCGKHPATNSERIYACFLLSRAIQKHIADGECFATDSDTCNSLIDGFLESIDHVAVKEKLRICWLLSAVDLHAVVQNQLHGNMAVVDDVVQTAASRILCQCIGRLAIELAKGCDSRQSERLYSTGLWSCISSISLCGGDHVLIASSTASIRSTPKQYRVSYAKALTGIALSWYDKGTEGSLQVMLAAIQVFGELEPDPSYQVANRLALLSTIYTSLEMPDEALFSCILGIAYDIMEESMGSHDDSEIDLVRLLAKSTKGLIPSDSATDVRKEKKGRITDLVRLVSQRDDREDSCSAVCSCLSSTEAILLLAEKYDHSKLYERFHNRCGGRFGFLNAIRSLICGLNKDYASPLTLMRILVGMVVSFGLALQDQLISTDTFTGIFQLTADFLETSPFKVSTKEALVNLLSANASVSVVSKHAPPDFTNWSSGRMREPSQSKVISAVTGWATAKSCSKLEQLSDDWSHFARTVRAAIDLFMVQFDFHMTKENSKMRPEILQAVQEDCERALSRVSCDSESVLPSLIRRSAFVVLNRLCDLRSLSGDDLAAIQISELACSHAKNTPLVSWFTGVRISHNATDRLSFGRLLSTRGTFTRPQIRPDNEIEACSMRLEACTCDDQSIYVTERKLRSMLTAMTNDGRAEEDAFLSGWTRTTVLLGLAECADRKGQMEELLSLLVSCTEELKALSKSLKSAMSSGNNFAFPEVMTIPSLSARCSQRRNDCLKKIACAYRQLGDNRRAIRFALKLCRIQSAGEDADEILNKGWPFSIALQRFLPDTSSRILTERVSLRFLLCLAAESRPVNSERSTIQSIQQMQKKILSASSFAAGTNSLEAEPLRCVIECLDYLNGSCFYPYNDHGRILETSWTPLREGHFERNFPQISYDFQYRRAATYLTSGEPIGVLEAISTLCKLGTKSDCTTIIRAGSFHIIGLHHLQKASEAGDILSLWTKDPDHVTDDIENARYFLTSALRLLGSICSPLKRNVLRCLALTLGPEYEIKSLKVTAATLVHASVGEATCRKIARCHSDHRDGRWLRLFEFNDNNGQQNLFEELAQRCSTDHRFVSIASCSSGELLIAGVGFRDGAAVHSVCCVFPTDESEGALRGCLSAFRTLVWRNNSQLEQVQTIGKSDREKKKQWWRERKGLDLELADILENFERELLLCGNARDAMVGQLSGKSLVDRFEQAVDFDTRISRLDQPTKEATPVTESSMKVTELVTELLAKGVEKKALRGLRKADLVRLYEEHCSTDIGNISSSSEAHHCLFLALDETLQQFPIEGMELLQGKAVCRQPSVAFWLLQLQEANRPDFRGSTYRPEKTSFILDPESNLKDTRNRLDPLLNRYNTTFGGSWTGIVDEEPDDDFLEACLTKSQGLMFYFGHGGGKKYLTKDTRRVVCKTISSSVILMGCSSALLSSSNGPTPESPSSQPSLFEPEGVALTYLERGAPCVVGNLWDVTDKDIDTFTEKMMEAMFVESESVATAVAESRDACKLRFLTGCAPVCYGLPIHSERQRGR